ncbi:hypothetical protein M8C21_032910, partial [Ambrosia artemisiifolia]
LQQHPLRTKALTAGVLAAISDVVSQKLSGIQKLQVRRLLLKVLFGCAYLGPFGHFYHTLLDKLFKGKKDNTTVVKKVVLDQLTASPWNNLMFMLYYGFVIEGRITVIVKTMDPRKIQNQEGIPFSSVCIMDVLACNRVDKPPPRATSIPCHCPKLCRNVLGDILESKSKINDIDQRLSK